MEPVAAIVCTPKNSKNSESRSFVSAFENSSFALAMPFSLTQSGGRKQSFFQYHYLFSSQLFDIACRAVVGNNSARVVQTARVGQPYFGREAIVCVMSSIYCSRTMVHGIVRSWQGLCEHVYSWWTECLVHQGEEKRTRVV